MEETTLTTNANVENVTPSENQEPAQQAVSEPSKAPQQQPDINAIVTKESRKAVEKLLKDAGIMPDDNPEMQLREYKTWLDSQKTELQKAQETATAYQSERDAAIAEKNALQRSMAAVAKGVPADKAEKYVKMAEASYMTDGVDFDAALEAMLKDFPISDKKGPPSKAGTHIDGGLEPKLDMNTFLRTKG